MPLGIFASGPFFIEVFRRNATISFLIGRYPSLKSHAVCRRYTLDDGQNGGDTLSLLKNQGQYLQSGPIACPLFANIPPRYSWEWKAPPSLTEILFRKALLLETYA